MSRYGFPQSLLAIIGLTIVTAVAPRVAAAHATPALRPRAPQCRNVPCGGSCMIPAPCTPVAGTACPDFVVLGTCEAAASGGCQCVPVPPLPPTPTPNAQCRHEPCGGPCALPFPGTCPRGALCVGAGRCEETAAGQCTCVPLSNVPTPTPTPSPCFDNVLCIRGSHWSPTQCQCVPDTVAPTPCVDTVLCVRGSHWSPTRCTCVPDQPSGPHLPVAPHAPHQPHTPGSAP